MEKDSNYAHPCYTTKLYISKIKNLQTTKKKKEYDP